MSIRLDPQPTATLLVLEADAAFPFAAACYRNPSNTAIIVQQDGESPMSLKRRIGHEARELERMGAKPETVVLIVSHRGRPASPDRRRIARALIEQLDSIDGTLILVADRAGPELRQDLMTLVGTLIEEDGVKHSIAMDFDATRMAELRATHAPMLNSASRTREADCAVAC